MLTRGVALSAALGKLACSAPADPITTPPAPTSSAAAGNTTTAAPTAEPTTSAVAEPLPPPAPDPSSALSIYTVTNASYVRRTLYTWTTADQIDELLRTHTLLSRVESPRHGRSFYDRKMDALWLAGDKLAALLRAPAFQKARFAWPAPWATMLGFPGETYGTELISVTLKPEAWIVLHRTSTNSWETRDQQGVIVSQADTLKHPQRIAAVHFVHDQITPPSTTGTVRASAGDGREAYREYILCNESMIESWSVGSAVTAEILAGADTVEAAAKYFAAHPPPPQRTDRWNAHVALLVWPGVVPSSTPKELYETALAFPNPNYAIDPEALRALATRLRALKQRAPGTTHRPLTAFPGARPVPVPPPPPPPSPWQAPARNKKWRGTF